MRILVLRIIRGKGTLKTDTIILRGRSLSWMLIWLSWGWVVGGRVRVGLGISLGWWRRIVVMGLTRGTRRTKRLTMGTIQHRRLIAISGISVLARTFLTRAGTPCIGAVDGRSRDKRSLRRDGMKQALLVEAHAVLTSAIRGAIIARATNLACR